MNVINETELSEELRTTTLVELRAKYARLFVNELEIQENLRSWNDACGQSTLCWGKTTTQKLKESQQRSTIYVAKHAHLQKMAKN